MIETDRLLLRPYTLADTSSAYSLFNDPEVMEFIPGGVDRSINNTRDRITKYINHYDIYGYSKYVVINKANKELIGDCGIFRIENTEINELGYRIKSQYWNKGYACEAACAVIKYSFEKLGLVEIHAIVETQNIKSIYILEKKLGFKYCGQIFCYGEDFKLYKLEK